MKALILIGGYGTRLRPFTLKTPKPLLPLVNRPFIEYQLEAIHAAGIRDVVLSIAYHPEVFREALGDGRRYGLRFHFAEEKTPLGTGGAVKNAEAYLDEPTVIFNGDILTDLDLKSLIRFHKDNEAELTITLTRVKDPTAYGLVETADGGRIKRFLEKPAWDEVTTNTVNAGTYIFDPKILGWIPPGIAYSLERGLFPNLLQGGHRLFGYVHKGYWMDIGTVEKYLQAHMDVLEGRLHFAPDGHKSGTTWTAPGGHIGKEVSFEGKSVLGARTKVADFVRFAGSVVVGPDCEIAQGAALANCIVLAGTRIGEGAKLEGCVVGTNSKVEPHSVLGQGTALGDHSHVTKFSQLGNGIKQLRD